MRKGFTLMELMIVVVVIGVITAFAIPNYTKAADKGKARDIVLNLTALGAAQEVYKARYGTYYLPIAPASVSNLNTTLSLNIIEQSGVSYQCSSAFSVLPPGGCLGALNGKWSYAMEPPSWVPYCGSLMGGHPCPNGV